MNAPLVVVGDVLLDRDVEGAVERLSPDAPVPVVDESASITRPGGAGLAAALAARDGREVTLVTALADDDAGRELRAALARHAVEAVDMGLDGRTAEKVRFMSDGRPLLRLDRGGREPGCVGACTAAAREAIACAAAVLVADYGRGVTSEPGMREALQAGVRRVPVVWDPHPRGATPVPGVCIAVPNQNELAGLVPDVGGSDLGSLVAAAGALRERWRAEHLCVTRSQHGALMVGASGTPLAVPAEAVSGADACGAGDRFAATLAGLLGDGCSPAEAITAAVSAASEFVAAGGAREAFVQVPEPEPTGEPALTVVRRVRAAGGTVVATGGCFDLLHPGHVTTLEAARSLGDCLVVLVNSDASVRRLKGPGRPLVPEQDRAAVLAALRCVDAVLVFDEDTPEAALERLRPDIWAKGGDYAASDLPESAVIERHGGRSVVLPYVDGRSTTRLIEEAAHSV
jgi:D-beta-D-heptose 7-phosphate kinase / D-beta-D-heptose 1-phosphate adenosyltransferase